MAAGDTINYTNYKNMYSEAWRDDYEYAGGDFPYYVCASAPSFVAQIHCETSGLFAKITLRITAYYFNGTGDGSLDLHWTQAWSDFVYAEGLGGSATKKFYHNRANEGTTSGDNHYVNLWKFKLERSTDGSNHSAYVRFWTGGIEMMNNVEYDNYCKKDANNNPCPIKYSSGQFWKTPGVYSSIADFVSSQRPSHFRGTPISVASGTANKICSSAID